MTKGPQKIVEQLLDRSSQLDIKEMEAIWRSNSLEQYIGAHQDWQKLETQFALQLRLKVQETLSHLEGAVGKHCILFSYFRRHLLGLIKKINTALPTESTLNRQS